MVGFQGELVLREKGKQIEQPESECSNKIEDRIEKYEKIVNILRKLTFELKIFGNFIDNDKSNIRPRIAIAYINFYENCIKNLRNGDLTEKDCDKELSLDYFLRECKIEEYERSIKLKEEITNLKNKLEQTRGSEKGDIKYAIDTNKEKISKIRERIIRNLESFEKKLNEYTTGVFLSLSKKQNAVGEDKLEKGTMYVVVPKRALEKSNYNLDIIHFKDIKDYLNKLYKEPNGTTNEKQLSIKPKSSINAEEVGDIPDKDFNYLTYFISIFWTSLIFPFISVNLVNSKGKLIFGNFLIFFLTVTVASIFSYKIGSVFKHLKKDKFMFFNRLVRCYFLIPFKPFLFLLKIDLVENTLERLDNKIFSTNKIQRILNKVLRIKEFVYAIQSYKSVILIDSIEESGTNGKRIVNKKILKTQQMLCPKCQAAGIKSRLIGISGKNGNYAVCELHSESHVFKIDPATLELEEIPYMDKKL